MRYFRIVITSLLMLTSLSATQAMADTEKKVIRVSMPIMDDDPIHGIEHPLVEECDEYTIAEGNISYQTDLTKIASCFMQVRTVFATVQEAKFYTINNIPY